MEDLLFYNIPLFTRRVRTIMLYMLARTTTTRTTVRILNFAVKARERE